MTVMEMIFDVYDAELSLNVRSLLKDSIQRVRGITQTLLEKSEKVTGREAWLSCWQFRRECCDSKALFVIL